MLAYERGRKRRDYFGIASLPFAILHLSSFVALRSDSVRVVLYERGWMPTALLTLMICWLLGGALAIVGIVLMRGRSTGGFTTLTIYAAIVMIRLFGLL